MAKVLVIGAGGVSSVCVHKMAMNKDIFSDIHLASRTKSKCDEGSHGRGDLDLRD